MAYTAPSGKTLRTKRGSLTDKIAAELSLIDSELETVSLGDIALNDGEMLVGNAANAAAAVTPSGDVTVSNAGVMTIGAKKVTAAKTALADGKIMIGGADGVAAEKAFSGAFTIDRDGVATLADSALSPAKLAVTDAYIIVGDGSGEGAAVAMSGDATIANTGAITIGAKKVTAAKTALADGKIMIGGADGVAAEQTLSGDVTVSNAGATTIGAKKVTPAMVALTEAHIIVGDGGAGADVAVSGDVTISKTGAVTIGAKKVGKAMLISEAEAVAGNIFVSAGAAYGIDEVAVSGDATLAANGALTIADSVLEGSNVANVASDNVIGGIPVIFEVNIEHASANNDVTSTHKVKVLDFWFIPSGTPSVNDKVQLLNGVNAITDDVACVATGNAVVRASTIDDTYSTISAGGTIRVAATADTAVAGKAYVMAMRVA